MTLDKNKKIVLGLAVMAMVVVCGVFGPNWLATEQRKAEIGLARPYFPYIDYSQKELGEKFQQIKYADVPTRVTPEETYAKFRQALKDNDLETAIAQLAEESERYEENVSDLKKAFEDGRFDDIFNSYSDKIIVDSEGESLSQFYFNYSDGNENRTHFLVFIKNENGDWKLDTL